MSRMIVYTRPGCQRCRATIRKAEALGAVVDTVDVEAVPAEGERLRAAGWTGLPVVEVVADAEGLVDLDAWSGYRPQQISEWALECQRPEPKVDQVVGYGGGVGHDLHDHPAADEDHHAAVDRRPGWYREEDGWSYATPDPQKEPHPLSEGPTPASGAPHAR